MKVGNRLDSGRLEVLCSGRREERWTWLALEQFLFIRWRVIDALLGGVGVSSNGRGFGVGAQGCQAKMLPSTRRLDSVKLSDLRWMVRLAAAGVVRLRLRFFRGGGGGEMCS
jgi:hypothetical protein